MPQKWKVERINQLKEELKGFSNYLFTDYRGLNVEQMNALRNTLREKRAGYHVVKNRFIKRVFNDLGISTIDQFLINPTALAYFNEDISEIAKILIDTAKDNTLQIKGGWTDGTILSFEDIENISELPSRQVLIGQTVGMLSSPMTRFVWLLSGLLSKFVRTLKAIEETRQ